MASKALRIAVFSIKFQRTEYTSFILFEIPTTLRDPPMDPSLLACTLSALRRHLVHSTGVGMTVYVPFALVRAAEDVADSPL